MFEVDYDDTDALREIRRKTAAMEDVLLGFADDVSPYINSIARSSIFAGVGTPSLQVRTGTAQREGLNLKRFNRVNSRARVVGETYWSHMTNLHDNFKKRRRLGLLRRVKREVDSNSSIQSIFQSALEDFGEIK